MGSFYAQPKLADTMAVQADMEGEFGVIFHWRLTSYGERRNVRLSLYALDAIENREMGVLVSESISYAAYDKKAAAVMLGMLNRLYIDWGTPSWAAPKMARERAARPPADVPQGRLPDSLPDTRRRTPR